MVGDKNLGSLLGGFFNVGGGGGGGEKAHDQIFGWWKGGVPPSS